MDTLRKRVDTALREAWRRAKDDEGGRVPIEGVPAEVWCERAYHRRPLRVAWSPCYYLKHEHHEFASGGYGDKASMLSWATEWLSHGPHNEEGK